MMFQLICVSTEYFDDRFQMFFHHRYSKPVRPPRYAGLGAIDVLFRYCQRSFDGTTLALRSGDDSGFRYGLV
jgi:hypothetical protein